MNHPIIKHLNKMKELGLTVNINMKHEEAPFEICLEGKTTYEVEEGFLSIHEHYTIDYEAYTVEDGTERPARTDVYNNHFLITVDQITSINEA